MTRTLPSTTITFTIARMIRVTRIQGLDHSTRSYKAAHAVAFSSRILASDPAGRVLAILSNDLGALPAGRRDKTRRSNDWTRRTLLRDLDLHHDPSLLRFYQSIIGYFRDISSANGCPTNLFGLWFYTISWALRRSSFLPVQILFRQPRTTVILFLPVK